METNSIITAPQIDGTHLAYEVWSRSHVGSVKQFLEFMTQPSAEREEFLASLGDCVTTSFTGNVAELTIKPML